MPVANDCCHVCIWCGSTKSERFKTPISVYRNRSYSFARCRSCGVKWAVPFDVSGIDYDAIQKKHVWYAQHRADNEWIRSILSNGADVYWTQRATDYLCSKTMDSRYVHALKRSVEAAKQGRVLRILEVGCNLGYVGATMMHHGHRYTGLDIQEDAITKAQEYYGDHFFCESIEKYVSHCREKFDLICSFEVVEHLPQPKVFLKTCLSLLNDDGELILTTPNGDQLRHDEWGWDLPPIHLTVFSRTSFAHLASSSLEVKFIDNVHLRYSFARIRRYGKRILKKFSSRHAEIANSVPILDPLDPNFYYGVERHTTPLKWNFKPVAYRSKMIAKYVVAMAMAEFGSKSLGDNLVVELTKRSSTI